MKLLVFLLVLFSLFGCKNNEIQPEISKEIIISGRVIDFDLNNPNLKIIVNRLGFRRFEIPTGLDSLGYFRATFESKIPTDVWVSYNTNFLVLSHPGDSIFVEFNGKTNNRPELLESIKFSGDAAKTNKDASFFQKMFFSNELYTDRNTQAEAVKNYSPKQYLAYLDTLLLTGKVLYDKFASDNSISNETKVWAQIFSEQNYYRSLANYPMQHRRVNGLNESEWKVPDDYKNSFLKRLPIKEEMFISGHELSSFVNLFHFFYLYPKVLSEKTTTKYKLNEEESSLNKDIIDSLMIFGILEQTKDSLLRQLVLAEKLYQSLDKSEVSLYEKYKSVADSIIKLPFLKERLHEEYKIIKYNLEHPKQASDAILMEAKNSSVDQIMDSILTTNKGKVIYIDLWATWCGSCIAEFPKSKILMNKLQHEDVTFINICIESEERLWKPILDKFELGGHNYFLTKKQSTEIKKAFGIQAVPYYVIIDKNGTISEKGSHLRPDVAESKILKLIDVTTEKLALFIINGKDFLKPKSYFSEFDDTNVRHIQIINPEVGKKKYGQKGENGVFIIDLYDDK
ncbi:TlpA family protein disulfide reductase [Arenibacter sp. TNZ]|uniref:TlpA family protein disulfide reductase n=1 Tax=Arenibacter TaxID=178469 RepID=UPI000CD3DC19|nr:MULTISPECIES: TlpA disulfide reductase family protein [Arenibacter]MCM4170805.1 TlpA family protein disulfide reductase [Arenibacter sp. TNZ]